MISNIILMIPLSCILCVLFYLLVAVFVLFVLSVFFFEFLQRIVLNSKWKIFSQFQCCLIEQNIILSLLLVQTYMKSKEAVWAYYCGYGQYCGGKILLVPVNF